MAGEGKARNMSFMLIVVSLVIGGTLAVAGWLAYRGYSNQNIWLLALVPGLAAGLLLWAATIVRLPFPIAAIALVVVALLIVAVCWWALRSADGAFQRFLVIGATTLVVLYVIWSGVLPYWVNREVVSPVDVLNPDGGPGSALVVYHPGLSSFQRDVSYAFAQGLVSNGWRVAVTTASSQAPTDLSNYDLLVLGAPTYDWLPAKRLQTYVRGVGDLAGQPTVTIITGSGYTELSQPAMEKLVQEAGGDLVKSLAVWTMRPNEEVYGTSDPLEAMRQSASDLPSQQK